MLPNPVDEFVFMRWKLRKIEKECPELEKFPRPIGRLLALRGICSLEEAEKFLFPDYDRDLHDPFAFRQMKAVVERFSAAYKNKEKIGIHGDYDADGVCGAALLADALGKLGFRTEVYIPHKEKDGHGLSVSAVEKFADIGVKLVVTVDCGITGVDSVALARQKGMDVIVIDHHQAPEVLPEALIINAKMPDSGYPFSDLCGTGAAFKVVQALYEKLMPEKIQQTKWLLDLVAIATVADMMPLRGENRVLVVFGLIVLAKSPRVGLRALFDSARLCADRRPLTARSIGFQIAPRLNAAGRMGHARDAYELLTETDVARAAKRAAALEELNNRRRVVCEKVVSAARAEIAQQKEIPAGIVLGHKDYFHGVVGLAAGKLAEEFDRPVGVFQRQGDILLGSFRSRNGIHIVEVLKKCSQHLLEFGGHAGAAGVKLRSERFELFVSEFNRCVAELSAREKDAKKTFLVEAVLRIDKSLPFLVDYLKKFDPFGEGNPVPLLALVDVVVVEAQLVGREGKHLKLFLADRHEPQNRLEAVGFGLGERVNECQKGKSLELIGFLEENFYGGQRTVQFRFDDFRAV